MSDWLWFLVPVALLPVAAASGWLVAHRARRRETPNGANGLRPDYFRGINYLLNEQPDKAIEAFIRVLEVDSETVETHLALGNLYRRRGEVDRAIRIHQNLIARPSLSLQQRHEALLELGQDYMSAGLLDRAENLFQELCETESFKVPAWKQIVSIYEQEKDWEGAIRAARELEAVSGDKQAKVIAHYYCERALIAETDELLSDALQAIRLALAADPGCVRASLLEAQLHIGNGDYEAALSACKRVEAQDASFLPEIIGHVTLCFRELRRTSELVAYLESLVEKFDVVAATLSLADLKRDQLGVAEAARFVGEDLRTRPSVRGFDYLLKLELESRDVDGREQIETMRNLTEHLIKNRVEYQCGHCGFPAKSLHWQCPACKHWSTIKPIQGVDGER